jgi:menaquinone-dependent protoporphyrinogen IX oxidase
MGLISNIKLERDIAKRKLYKQLVVHVAIRAKHYDKIVAEFIYRSPEGVVVRSWIRPSLFCVLKTEERFFICGRMCIHVSPQSGRKDISA